MPQRSRRFKFPTRSVSAFLIACLLTVLMAAPPAQATSTTFTTSGSWTAPANVTSITVECWGGGGGGGSDSSSSSGGGGGGGGGAYARVNTFTVIPGNSYAYVVGSGGGAATAGGNSSFNGTTCVAVGGAGGVSSDSGAGGVGGTAASSTGDVNFPVGQDPLG